MLVCAIWRTVCLPNSRPPRCTATAQVPTHCSAAPPAVPPAAEVGAGSAGVRGAVEHPAAVRTAIATRAVIVVFQVPVIAPTVPKSITGSRDVVPRYHRAEARSNRGTTSPAPGPATLDT
ncbi:hypothetical protein Ade02nite_57530 [Paractinoplanes deccanensis]|uniref:Uncharacterized protein n=1 Tax=Paractinoplanes deccanensis TaxID=113561 RepID=A0ABQ3YAV5_9ACTN|nr:hypothetical protein Ade02nite_57530 [Actinoplanes deccanensis]